jgi:hypothetical protein
VGKQSDGAWGGLGGHVMERIRDVRRGIPWSTPHLTVISRGLTEHVLETCKGDNVIVSPFGDYEQCASNSAYCELCHGIASS